MIYTIPNPGKGNLIIVQQHKDGSRTNLWEFNHEVRVTDRGRHYIPSLPKWLTVE